MNFPRLLLPALLLVGLVIPTVHAQSGPPLANSSCLAVAGNPNCLDSATDLQINPSTYGTSQITQGSTNIQIGMSNTIDGRSAQYGATNNIQIGEYSSITGLPGQSASINNSIGQTVTIQGFGNNVLGSSTNVQGNNNTLIGTGTASLTNNGTVVGVGGSLGADATGSVLLGGGYTDRSGTVAINNLTLSQMAPGILATDGVNVSQLNQGLSYLGAGAGLNNGVFTAPSYVLSGGTFNNVGSALLYLDSKPSGTGSQGPAGPQGPQGPAGSGANVVAGKNITVTQDANGNQVVATTNTPTFSSVTTSNANSTTTVSGDGVVITPATSNAVTLSGAGLDNGGNVINGVANGRIVPGSQQAINGGQLYAAQQADRNWAKSYTDQAVQGLNDRIARVGATSAASAALASNYRDTPNSFAAGLGFQGGHNAIAVGYRHVSESQRVSWSIQGAISGSERSIGVGIGYGW